jgi:hypothetical protein
MHFMKIAMAACATFAVMAALEGSAEAYCRRIPSTYTTTEYRNMPYRYNVCQGRAGYGRYCYVATRYHLVPYVVTHTQYRTVCSSASDLYRQVHRH